MLTLTTGLAQLRPYYNEETCDVFRVLLNSTSAAEASLALEVLDHLVPEKPLVTACNLREVLRSLPPSPFTMRVDERILCRTAGLQKNIAVFSKMLPDDLELAVTTAGNLVLDVIVKQGGEKYFLTPVPVTDDYINPTLVDLIISSSFLLDEIIGLVKCMGVVFNPKFYLSIDDFHLEYAAEAVEDLGYLF